MDIPLILILHSLITVSCLLCVISAATNHEHKLMEVHTVLDDCYTETNAYAGMKSTTISGRKCQAWSVNQPHKHYFHNNSMFSDGSVFSAANFCRDPGRDGYLWCYTLDPLKRSEECPIRLCNVHDWTEPCIKDETSGHCYQIIDTKITWYNANYWCKREGGNLSIIESSKEQQFIADLLRYRNFNVSGLWIGSDKLHPEDQRAWINGEIFSYANWANGEPNSRSIENCVEMYTADSMWNDVICTALNGYICENSRAIDRYVQDNTTGIFYQLVDTSITWDKASNICIQYGGMLVNIETSQEQKFIADQIQKINFTARSLWLGSNNVHPEKARTWNNGKKFKYANWAKGEPNNLPITENCAEMYTGTLDNTWNDVECTKLRGLICEKEPQVIPDQSQRHDVLIGIVVGSVLVLGVCILLLCCLIRKRCGKKHKNEEYQDVQQMEINQVEHEYAQYVVQDHVHCNPDDHYSNPEHSTIAKEIY